MALSNWARGEDGEAGRRRKAEREDMDKHHFVHRPVGGGYLGGFGITMLCTGGKGMGRIRVGGGGRIRLLGERC